MMMMNDVDVDNNNSSSSSSSESSAAVGAGYDARYAWIVAASDLELDPSEATGLPVCAADCLDGALFYHTLGAWLVRFDRAPRAGFYRAWFRLSAADRAELVRRRAVFVDELGEDTWIPALARRDDAAMLAAALSAGALVAPHASVASNTRRPPPPTTATLILAIFEHGATECMALLMRHVAPGDWSMAFALALSVVGMRLHTQAEWEAEARALGGHVLEFFLDFCMLEATPFAAADWACCLAAARGHLALLRLLREQGGCEWSGSCPTSAAAHGHAACLRHLVESQQCPWNRRNVLLCAASGGNLDCVEFALGLRSGGGAGGGQQQQQQQQPNNFEAESTMEAAIVVAAARGRLAALRLLLAAAARTFPDAGSVPHSNGGSNAVNHAAVNGCTDCLRLLLLTDPRGQFANAATLEFAAAGGHLDCLRLLRGEEQAGDRVCSWGGYRVGGWEAAAAMISAAVNGKLDCLRYVVEAGCPRPDDATRVFDSALSSGCVRTLEYVCTAMGIADNQQPRMMRPWCVYCGARSVECMRFVRDHGLAPRTTRCNRCIENAANDPARLRFLLEEIIGGGGVVGAGKEAARRKVAAATDSRAAFLRASTQIESLRLLHDAAGLRWTTPAAAEAAAAARLLPKHAVRPSVLLSPDGRNLCAHVAACALEDPECLIYLHDVVGCEWDQRVFESTMFNAKSFATMQAARDRGCPWSAQTTEAAARTGNLAALRWLHERGCPWTQSTCLAACRGGHVLCLRYARERGCPWDLDECVTAAAAANRRGKVGAAGCVAYLAAANPPRRSARIAGAANEK